MRLGRSFKKFDRNRLTPPDIPSGYMLVTTVDYLMMSDDLVWYFFRPENRDHFSRVGEARYAYDGRPIKRQSNIFGVWRKQ